MDADDPTLTQIDPRPPSAAVEPEGREFAAFYRSFVPRLISFLVFHGASLHEATDLAQETMIDAWRSWPAIEWPEAWCRRVASRKFGAFLARVEDPTELESSPLLPSHVDVAEFEANHAVLAMLRLLPPRERQVMAWTVDGYSDAEIAAELNLTPSAVSTYRAQARRRLAIHRGAL